MTTRLSTASRTAAGLATALTLGAALAGGASAAPPGPAAAAVSSHHRYATSGVVLTGGFNNEFGPALRGNRHQVRLTTDNGVPKGWVRSFYCPSGASVTPTWASSRCTHRQTIYLKRMNRTKVGWVSSTSLSATQKGQVLGQRGSSLWPLEPNFTLYATSAPMDDGDGTFYSYWREARVTGSFAGLSILSGSKQEGWIGGYGPV